MKLFNSIFNKPTSESAVTEHEFCPRCEANLTLQKGYSNALPYWNCKGCGEMLINPAVDSDDDIAWICDGCGQMLNVQAGFADNSGEWKCLSCGTINKIDESELYDSTDEYLMDSQNPYKGLSDEDVLAIASYQEVSPLNDREDIIIVKGEDDHLYVKKILKDYDISIYRYLKEHPVSNMPRLISLHKGKNSLIVIEEFIDGATLEYQVEHGFVNQKKAIAIAKNICKILMNLHNQEKPIIHRDIKPSNIIITPEDEVYLLDINVAKWFKPDEAEDTRLMGTLYYAAPEQFGYGFQSSSAKSDIYSLGMLLNVMLTGKMPKQCKATGKVWDIISRCISMNPDVRPDAKDLLAQLEDL